MSVERTSCRSCGNALLPTDAFCSGCGIPVRARALDAGQERRTLVRDALPTADRRHCRSCNAPLFPGDSFCAACGSTLAAGDAAMLPDSGTKLRSLIEEASQGRYRIVREIGRGGMGAVFLAHDEDLSRRVAIKVLSGAGGDPATLHRFEREARTVAQLRHEAIVRVHAVGGLGDLHYFVMDYVEGVSLQRLLVDRGRLPIAMVEAVLFRVAAGLAYAHGQASPVIHRDVKPSNILVDTDGQVILMDFGVAKVGDEAVGLTRTGMIVGTAEYMSPEQVRSLPVTPATDQYALGAVTFAMLMGRPPFAGSFYEVLIAHQKEPIPDVRQARPDVPEALAAAVERMLAKDPADRWPDLPTLLRELKLRPLSPYDATTQEMSALASSLYQGDVEASLTGETPGATGGSRATGGLRIALPTSELEVGDTVSPEVGFETPSGLEPAEGVTWSVDPPGIVRLDPQTGELVAVGPGTTRVTARTVAGDGSVDLTVTPPEVSQVSIRPESLSVAPGEVVRLEAVTLSRSGRPLDHPRTWASSDPSVVVVSPEGEVRGVRAGSASVVVYCDSGWAAAAVRVEATSATAVMAGPPPETASGPTTGAADRSPGVSPPPPPPPPPSSAGSKPRAQEPSSTTGVRPPRRGVITRPSRELGAPAPDRRGVMWAGGVAVLAVVAAAGTWFLSGRGGGAEGAGSGGTPTSLVLTLDGAAVEPPLELTAGMGVDLGLRGEDGAAPDDVDGAVWTSSAPEVASVDAGRVTAMGPGEAEVTVSVAGLRVTVPVRVRPPWVALDIRGPDGASAAAAGIALTEGESAPLTGVLVDSAGAVVEGPEVTWTSEDDDVAAPSASGVRGVRAGRTVLTARAGGMQATIPIQVAARTPAPTPTPQRREEPPPPVARPPAPAPQATGRGTLVIVVTPGWANAFLDGQPMGEYSSRYEIELDAGSYDIRLENPAFAPADTTLTIRPGETTRWERRLGNGSDQ